MANPTFEIHRIGRKSDNKFFQCFDSYSGYSFTREDGYVGYYDAYFTNQGAFFRKMDTIRKHLRCLMDGDSYKIKDFYIETYSVHKNTKKQIEAREVYND